MASYDLKCRSCGKEFEVFLLGFLKDDAKLCPECGGRDVEQRFTGFGGVTGFGSASPSCAYDGRRNPRGCSPPSGFS